MRQIFTSILALCYNKGFFLGGGGGGRIQGTGLMRKISRFIYIIRPEENLTPTKKVRAGHSICPEKHAELGNADRDSAFFF